MLKGSETMAVKLSVVVPVYGTARYLRTCLDSLSSNTLHDAEFILVNDASPDNAADIMAEYAVRDARFRILTHERNLGLFAARLTGARAARGEYIAFLDSDDYVSVDFYRAAVSCADRGGYDIVMGDTVWVEADGRCVTRPVHADLIPDEPLLGDAVRHAFYGQEMTCYSWHTIWNKLIRRELFTRCMPWFERMTGHIVMTEDIAFSAVLMYEAQSFIRHRGDGVFYCMHNASATGSAYADRDRFFRNYGNIVTVFEFVEAFLREKDDKACLEHLMNARRWYCRMWAPAIAKCAVSQEDKAAAEKLTARLAPGFTVRPDDDCRDIWWFDRHTVPWNDGLERIKRAIAGLDGRKPEIVSFDVFDTLLQRPFRQPSDLRLMLEPAWQKANRRCMLSFAEARGEAEGSARAWVREIREDISLGDIYAAMRLTAGVTEDCAETMRHAEAEAEISFCRPRRSGVQLFELAKHLGRRVILISDMYLERDTITQMLNKCGVSGWEAFFLSCEENALKWNGGIYRKAIAALNAAPESILHIGDNWHNDCLKPRELGMHTMHHPRAMDVMTDVARTQLGQLGCQTAASFAGEASLQGALSFRCMQAMTAIRFFDHGFAPTTRSSSFACSPAMMGYYAVGGHVLSVAQWLIARAKRDGVRRLLFLARDGLLMKLAVDQLLTEADGIETDYQPASRRMLLPALTVNRTDFNCLPINIPAYSVMKLLNLLDFCTADMAQAEIRSICESAGFAWEEPFPGKYRYTEFIRWYLDNLYDGRKHQRAYNLLREYFEPILTPGTACFDMGYTGRLQSALNQLAGQSIPVYFIHDDGLESERLSDAFEFEVRCFYGLKPGMSGAYREFLLSSAEPPCTGVERTAEGVRPVYGECEYSPAARALIRCIQDNALRFVRDYVQCFKGTPAERLQPMVCSMPFESLLRYSGEEDLSLLEGISFEDTVFAGRRDLDLSALVRDQSAAANSGQMAMHGEFVGFVPSQTPLIKRTIGFLLFDRILLKEKAKKRLTQHPFLYGAAKACWRGVKNVRRLLRREGR